MIESPSRESMFLRKFFLGVLVAALVFGCICVVIAVLIDGFNDDLITMRLVVTPTIVLFCGCMGLMGAMIHQTGRLVGYIRVMLGPVTTFAAYRDDQNLWLSIRTQATLSQMTRMQ